jgi:hypothetical protein
MERDDMKQKTNQVKILSCLLSQFLIIAVATTTFFSPVVLLGLADQISDSWHNTTTLNVTNLEIRPRINWYDFQYNDSGTWVSKRNAEIDVNNSAEYRFALNISSDQGWTDINWVNITAWYDNGTDNSTYNQTMGSNYNLAFQYENTTGTAIWRLLWPHGGEVTESQYIEADAIDTYGSPGFTECKNMTFAFIPNYQFRYAPGDGSWDNTANITNDPLSWNFFVYIEDASGNYQTVTDEFGVFSYTEVVSAGWPVIIGNPGTLAVSQSNITVVTRSNGNYSLSVDVDNLTHKTFPAATMSRDNVWVRGGDLDASENFTELSGVIWLYGSNVTYHPSMDDGTNVVTNDIEYMCDIPLGQMAGDYTATIEYHLQTT